MFRTDAGFKVRLPDTLWESKQLYIVSDLMRQADILFAENKAVTNKIEYLRNAITKLEQEYPELKAPINKNPGYTLSISYGTRVGGNWNYMQIDMLRSILEEIELLKKDQVSLQFEASVLNEKYEKLLQSVKKTLTTSVPEVKPSSTSSIIVATSQTDSKILPSPTVLARTVSHSSTATLLPPPAALTSNETEFPSLSSSKPKISSPEQPIYTAILGKNIDSASANYDALRTAVSKGNLTMFKSASLIKLTKENIQSLLATVQIRLGDRYVRGAARSDYEDMRKLLNERLDAITKAAVTPRSGKVILDIRPSGASGPRL